MILLAAATPWETRPLCDAFGLRAVGPLRVGRCAGRELGLLRTGVGAERTRGALASLKDAPVRALVSVGFAGALRDDLRPGELVIDLRGAPQDWLEAARKAAAGAGPLHLGPLADSERVLTEPSQKRALGAAQRAAAVDMESATLRSWAAERGLPFMAARVILDAASEAAPSEAPADDAPWTLAAYGLRNWRELPRMFRLAGRQRPAMDRLCAFLRRWLEEVTPA
ncbi:MAG: hypothetical protein WC969_04315 [Elusimicrobiota bacterium]